MDVIVIGAGLSGLTAAAVLIDAGSRVTVLEADTRIGGRIQALQDPQSGHAIADLGPTWVWPQYQPVVTRWLKKLGQSTFAQFNTGNAVITGYGPNPVYQYIPAQDGMLRVVGGPTALIDALAAHVGQVNIRPNAPAARVCADGPDRVSVALESGETLTADRVIIAVPLRVAATMIDMPWAPDSLLQTLRNTPTWMSTHAKAVAIYKQPFWREAGLSGRIASRTGPLVEGHDHSSADMKSAALFGFIGWPAAQRQSNPDHLRQQIMAQLIACFGAQAANPVDLAIQDWASNPRIVTNLDLTEPPQHPLTGPASLRAKHLDGRVRFAVSEVSDRSPGLIEGALAAGETSALDLLQPLSIGQ